jgi:peptide/nickel transport system substrate-binding protein
MRTFLIAAGLFAVLCLGAATPRAEETTLRFIPQADLRSLDPVWTTAYITRNHGYMVFDTLFGTDAKFQPQPEMVDSWEVSPDKLRYTFKLRDKLKFHDGTPVRGIDCVASLQRWTVRDPVGQMLTKVLDHMAALDDQRFEIVLKSPFPLMLAALAKVSGGVPFIMPERLAKTPADQQITEMVGSGPFIFVKEEFEPGHKVVYRRNPDYVPRAEPPSGTAGGKVVKVDRVEWIYIPDQSTAFNALSANEVDWWQQVPTDVIPALEKTPGVKVAELEPVRFIGNFVINHLNPPFNNVKLRQAVLHAIDQTEYMAAVAGDPRFSGTCYSYFICGAPMSNEAGAEPLKNHNLAEAKRLVAESGYNGETAVVLDATDYGASHAEALVTADLFRQLGIKTDLQAMDWGSVINRRTKKDPVEKGGWSVFFGSLAGADVLDPAVNFALRGNGEKAWFGWPTDPKIEELREKWIYAEDEATRKKLAEQVQEQAFKTVPIIPLGQYAIPSAYRTTLSGIVPAPVTVMWNVEKKGS